MATNNESYIVRLTNTSTHEAFEVRFETQTQAKDYIDKFIGQQVKPSVNNNVCKTISRKQLNQLTSTVSSLPTEKLLQQVKTTDALLLRTLLNEEAQLLSKCLAARLLRQDGDPARHLLSGDKFDKLRHQVTWATVEKYDTLLSLIQMAWQPISEELSNFAETPKNGFALFLRIIIDSFDEPFMDYLRKDFKISPSIREAMYGARAKIFYRNNVPLTKKEQAALKRSSGHDDYWLKLTLSICNADAKQTQNTAIAAKLREYFNKEGLLSDCMYKFYAGERKAKGDTLIWEAQCLRM